LAITFPFRMYTVPKWNGATNEAEVPIWQIIGLGMASTGYRNSALWPPLNSICYKSLIIIMLQGR
jgi:hypothetical protein